MSINDKLLPLLEKIHLAGFFEEKNIPPIAFPIGMIVLIGIIAFLLFSGGSSNVICGDALCDSTENCTTCPEDCGNCADSKKEFEGLPATKEVSVILTGAPIQSTLSVSLQDDSGTTLQGKTGKSSEFTFQIPTTANVVRAIVKNLDTGNAINSDFFSIEVGDPTIPVMIPSDFFDQGHEETATLIVSLKNAKTMTPISGKISIVLPSGSSYSVVETKQSTGGVASFSLEPGTYAVITEASAYSSYDNRNSPVTLSSGRTLSITAPMEPVTKTRTINFCAGQNAPIIAVYTSSGTLLSELTTDSFGCAEFEMDEGTTGYARAMALDPSCSSSDAMFSEDSSNSLVISVVCGDMVSQIRAEVIGLNNEVLTENATVNLFYEDGTRISGSGTAGALMPNGTATEYVHVDSTDTVYFVVTGVNGYLDFTSRKYEVLQGEAKTVKLNLIVAPEPKPEMEFRELYFPTTAIAGKEFKVSFQKALCNGEDVTATENFKVSFTGGNCSILGTTITYLPSVSHLGEQTIEIYNNDNADCIALIKKNISVFESGENPFEVIPYAITGLDAPVTVPFAITFNGTPILNDFDYILKAKYSEGGIALPEEPLLSEADEYLYTKIDSPFTGDHALEINLSKVVGDVYYAGSFEISNIRSYPRNQKIKIESTVSPRFPYPTEGFYVAIKLQAGSWIIKGLENVYAEFYSTTQKMYWNPASQIYSTSFEAPLSEGIFPVTFKVGGATLAEENVYVANTALERSSTCEIANCADINDVRACVYSHNKQSMHTTREVIGCFENGWGTVLSSEEFSLLHCTEDSASKGDWNNNCYLDTTGELSDRAILSEALSRLSEDELYSYLGCGDMDNDLDVDKDDLVCLTNVASGKWFGDTGTSSNSDICSSQLMGGFCFDIKTSSAIPGDFNNDKDIDSDDIELMQDIIRAVRSGVTPPSKLLAFADFNQDRTIGQIDLECLEKFKNVNFDSYEAYGQQVSFIPSECLAVFNLECGNKGDINDDGKIDEIDFTIIKLAANGLISEDVVGIECLDVDIDSKITKDDVTCLSEYFNGDMDEWMLCLNCEENLPPEAWSTLEICNDGYDNNCDNLKDLEDPMCSCINSTSCDMVYDTDRGVNVGVEDDKYEVCRSVSWDDHKGYTWYEFPFPPECEKDNECETYSCDGNTWQCSTGEWYKIAPTDTLPGETCGDGWDNDCSGGDAACPSRGGDEVPDGCPFIYAYDGKNYVLEAAGFSLALAKPLEGYSYSALPDMAPTEKGTLNVSIAQQLPEKTRVNTMRLFAINHLTGLEIVPGTQGEFYTILNPASPVSCHAVLADENCLSGVLEPEGKTYLYNLSTRPYPYDFDKSFEYMELTFDLPEGASEDAVIILKGKVQHMMVFATWAMFENMGNGNLGTFAVSFFTALPSFIDRNGKVKVDVERNGNWEFVGHQILAHSIAGDAGKIAIPVKINKDSDELKIRLGFRQGGFEIDYVALDASGKSPIEVEELPMLSAKKNDGNDVLDELLTDDDKYEIITQGEWIETEFALPARNSDLPETSYVVWPKGYFTFEIDSQFTVAPMDVFRTVFDDSLMHEYVAKNYLPNIEAFRDVYYSVDIGIND